jgi:hypothetical protein
MQAEPPPPPRKPGPTPSEASRPDRPSIADVRGEFRRRTGARNEDEERAFVEAKLEMVRTDPRLSDIEKQAAIAELESKLRPDRKDIPPN